MFDFLNSFGLPIKYAIIATVFGAVWVLVVPLFGFAVPRPALVLAACAAGGFAAGVIRRRRKRRS